MKLLIVDDSPEDREWYRRNLNCATEKDYTILETETGEDGLEAFRKERPDCILLDYGLPDLSGLEFIDACKKETRYPPIVMLTGQGDESISVEAMKKGAQDYLVKGRVTPTELLRAVSNATEKARLLRKNAEYLDEIKNKLQAARAIQQGLLPASPVSVSGVEIGGVSYPADSAGGDYFDILPALGDGIGIVVGDVSGHGFHCAILAAALHTYVRALALKEANISQLLMDTSSLFRERNPEEKFATMILISLDLTSRTLAYASAGHPTGFVLTADGVVRETLKSTATVLGLIPDVEFPAATPMRLEPGDTVVLTTDGVGEARANDELFGDDRILEAVRSHLHQPAQEIAEHLCDTAKAFHTDPEEDDITAVIIKCSN